MNPSSHRAPSFWAAVRTLLGAAHKRSSGRRKRQQELLQNRKHSSDWSGVGFFFTALLMFALNILAAFVANTAVETGQRLEAERHGKIVVDNFFLQSVGYLNPNERQPIRPWVFAQEAQKVAARCGGSTAAIEQQLRQAYERHGTQDFTIAYNSSICTDAASQDNIAVSRTFYSEVAAVERANRVRLSSQNSLDSSIHIEARSISQRYGGDPAAIERQLHDSIAAHGTANLVSRDEAMPGVSGLARSPRLPAMLGSIVLLWWFIMLVFQGEGLELDLQRRRNPMWEWLFSHPAPPGAIFLAEMLSPIAANPIYWGGPLFVGFLYGFAYGPSLGALAAILIGIPITVTAACVGKACEIGAVLRFAPRTRGAMVGLMSWLGYASMMGFFLGLFVLPKVITAIAPFLNLFTFLPWPWLRLFLGGTPFAGNQPGSFSFPLGTLTCWIASVLIVTLAVWFSVWGAQQGLSGNFAAADSRPLRKSSEKSFGREPLYRKEFLWFIRDRSAIVQTILIPLTVASIQAFNLRGVLNHAQSQWNYLCGAAIFFGTYFLWILGPKSLSSEGSALWIALTWPRGLESLLKAKAWLWSLISTGIVAIVLLYAAFLFPHDIPKILLLGVGWFFFGRSMAEKSVTLVTVTSDSGEQEKVPKGRRWAAQLGMLTFAIGVLTQQWHIAVMGIVYSFITAAAMWQNFRARLPYLYDPWSETVPAAPTLMHAMIAISILVECGAIVTGILAAALGRNNIAVAQALSYAICAVFVSIGTAHFLGNRDVAPHEVWTWPTSPVAETQQDTSTTWRQSFGLNSTIIPGILAGAGGGLILGLFAHGYLGILARLPVTANLIRQSQQQLAAIPNLRISYLVMAVLFAPFAEEYLFRGLLYRALDREWGGWKAVLGSAAFFAIYHPPLSWLPVFLLGAANALLFKKSGRLAPAVILHMIYNAVVLL